MLENSKTKVRDIIASLSQVRGLSNITLLKDEDKDIIRNLEDEENEGVFSCLDKQFTLVLIHNSDFRTPEGEIVRKENGKIIFPPIPFSEVNAKNVVSSSPNKDTHEFLIKQYDFTIIDEATLLIGFDL
mgnify:FL=1